MCLLRQPERDSTWFRIAISLALAGQGMVFGLGYNNALRAGEAPPFGSPAYLAIHGGLFLSVVVVTILLGGGGRCSVTLGQLCERAKSQ